MIIWIIAFVLIYSLLFFIIFSCNLKKELKYANQCVGFKNDEIKRLRDSLVEEEVFNENRSRTIVELSDKIEKMNSSLHDLDTDNVILTVENSKFRSKLNLLKKIPSKKKTAALKKSKKAK